MITINQMNAPLELELSLYDLFGSIRQHQSHLRNQDITYSYLDILTIREHIGTPLGLEELIFYPSLCKALRKLKQLVYEVDVSLRDVPTLKEKGLTAINKTIFAIEDKLKNDRTKKATLDAQFYNLVYLYGQNKTIPILRDFKHYYTTRYSSYNYHRSPYSKKLNISGVNYYLGKRCGTMKNLYQLSEYHLLSCYYEATKKEEQAITKTMHTKCIGGFINTPVFAFRVKNNHKQAGRKYYIDLATNKTYTRLTDAKITASNYHKNPELTLLETIK